MPSKPRLEGSKPSLQWYAGVSQEDKIQFETVLNANRNNSVILRLIELIDAKITDLNNQSEDEYKSQAWPYKQADINGQKRGLRFVKDLLKFTNADHAKELN